MYFKIMKKNLIIYFLFWFCSLTVYSQVEYAFIIEDSDGFVISHNETLEFDSIEFSDATFNFFVRNLTSDQIFVKAELTSISGTDGTGMEFCFGECYFGISLGLSYPLSSYVSIEPGETQVSSGDHFFNQDPGDGTNPVEYSFRFYMVDQNGDEVASIPELQTDYRVNYMYSSTLTINEYDSSKLKFRFNNNQLNIISEENIFVSIYNIHGKKILDKNILIGENFIDFSSVANKILILNFETNNNIKFSKKILFP